MTITAEAIKAQQSKIELNEGEKYVGCIISADGSIREHIILLPGEKTETDWANAMHWAKSIGGELPSRLESALLFATMKDQFQPEWYWTREQYAHNDQCAWIYFFGDSNQVESPKSYMENARAVRRLSI